MSARGRPSLGAALTLARLARMRVLPLAALAALALTLVLVRAHELARLTGAPRIGLAPTDAGAALRPALWSVCALIGLPFVVARAAGTFARWQRGEIEFLAPRAAPRLLLVGASWLGCVLALVLIGLVALLAVELGVPGGPTLREGARLALPRSGWITGAEPWQATLELPRPTRGTRLSLELGLGAGGGPATEVRLSARGLRPAATQPLQARARLGTRGTLEVELPEGATRVELELALSDPDARVFLLSDEARLWTPAPSARQASLELFLRLVLLGAAASALALGAGAFLAPAVAGFFVLALWVVPDVLALDPSWIPARDLFAAIDVAARGRVPAGPPAQAFLGAALVVAVALGSCAWTRAAWRRSR